MSFVVRREIEHIKKQVLSLSAVVEQSVIDAVKALEKKDAKLAQSVIARDAEVDAAEVDIEEDCLKIIALHQPVAIDLRFIVAVLKINNDLERIGDLAVNIAQSARILAGQERIRLPHHFTTMAERTIEMLHLTLDSLINLDPATAQRVLRTDDEVDDLHKHTFDLVEGRLKENPELSPEMIRLLGISRNLERIADHATNIAEDIIYMIEGEIVRHSLKAVDSPPASAG